MNKRKANGDEKATSKTRMDVNDADDSGDEDVGKRLFEPKPIECCILMLTFSFT